MTDVTPTSLMLIENSGKAVVKSPQAQPLARATSKSAPNKIFFRRILVFASVDDCDPEVSSRRGWFRAAPA